MYTKSMDTGAYLYIPCGANWGHEDFSSMLYVSCALNFLWWLLLWVHSMEHVHHYWIMPWIFMSIIVHWDTFFNLWNIRGYICMFWLLPCLVSASCINLLMWLNTVVMCISVSVRAFLASKWNLRLCLLMYLDMFTTRFMIVCMNVNMDTQHVLLVRLYRVGALVCMSLYVSASPRKL